MLSETSIMNNPIWAVSPQSLSAWVNPFQIIPPTLLTGRFDALQGWTPLSLEEWFLQTFQLPAFKTIEITEAPQGEINYLFYDLGQNVSIHEDSGGINL